MVSQELLHEAYQRLFPAERMLVVAGRRMGETTRLTDIMDVTGDQSADTSARAREASIRYRIDKENAPPWTR